MTAEDLLATAKLESNAEELSRLAKDIAITKAAMQHTAQEHGKVNEQLRAEKLALLAQRASLRKNTEQMAKKQAERLKLICLER